MTTSIYKLGIDLCLDKLMVEIVIAPSAMK